MNLLLSKLISISSESIGDPLNESQLSRLPSTLRSLYCLKNGFYAFESALHVFHLGARNNEADIIEWNYRDLWKDRYGIGDDHVFFAEDIFGGQFCVDDEGVHSFDPETGEMELLSASIESWAKAILEDYNYLTGYSVAHAWQAMYGSISIGNRLIPKIPFVAGGGYDIGNLREMCSVDAMRKRAEFLRLIKNVCDGEKIIYDD